jgi:hypothetical protein
MSKIRLQVDHKALVFRFKMAADNGAWATIKKNEDRTPWKVPKM